MDAKKNLEVEMWKIGDVRPYDKNAKIHTESQIEALVKVIRSQGWDVPIVVDSDGVIIKGHGRRMAAIKMGLTKVPVICRRDLTPEQVRAARLSDNRVAMGEFDTNLLQEELNDLAVLGFELENMGFDEKELDFLSKPIDGMDDSILMTGLDELPGEQKALAEKKELTGETVPVTKALGFKTLPAEFQRALAKAVAFAEAETGAVGGEAFGRWMQSVVTEWELR